jgi:hypothetical protein
MQLQALAEMADLLNSEGINYSVFLAAYSRAVARTSDVGDIVKGLIGNDVVVSDVCNVDVTSVKEELRQCLGYVGEEVAGPGMKTLNSEEFSRLFTRFIERVEQLSETSYGLKSLQFSAGHPAYPVFWDFAFLFLRDDEHVLLVGSSSD